MQLKFQSILIAMRKATLDTEKRWNRALDDQLKRTLAVSLVVRETVAGGTAAEKGTDGVTAVVLAPSVVHRTFVHI